MLACQSIAVNNLTSFQGPISSQASLERAKAIASDVHGEDLVFHPHQLSRRKCRVNRR